MARDDIRMKIDMTGREYVDFLRKLATDDSFRTALQKDPAATLAAHGITVDPQEMPEKVVLPPKGELQGHLSQMEEKSNLSFVAFPMFLFPRG